MSQLVQIATAEVPDINRALVMLQAQINLLAKESVVEVAALRDRMEKAEAQVAVLSLKSTRRT